MTFTCDPARPVELPEKLLTVAEVADLLRVTRQTVLVERGRTLPEGYQIGKKILFDERDIAALFA